MAIWRYSARRLSASADRPRRILGQSLFRFASRKKGKNRLERSPAPKRSPIALVISREKMDRRANGEPNSVQPNNTLPIIMATPESSIAYTSASDHAWTKNRYRSYSFIVFFWCNGSLWFVLVVKKWKCKFTWYFVHYPSNSFTHISLNI